MIRINLLNEHDLSGEESLPAERSTPFKKRFLLIIIFFAIAGVVGYLSRTLLKTEQVMAEVPIQQKGPTPQKPEYQPKVVISNAVEEIVKEIEGENRRKPRISTYKDLKPAAKIEYQLLVCKRVLSHIKSVTSSEIGFTDLIVTTPGDIYIHGMASSKKNYENFRQNFAKPSYVSAKPGITKQIAPNEETMEFSLYGRLKLKAPDSRKSRSIKKSQLKENVERFKEVLKSSDLTMEDFKLKSVSNVGAYKRHIYQLSLKNCSFSKFQNFVTKLQVAKANTGILKFALKAAENQEMTANIDMVLYLK